MSESVVHGVNSLGTASLLRDLRDAQQSLESFNASSPEHEATDILEQTKDLVDITTSFDNLATKERRNPSAYPEFLSASDLVHLASVLGSIAAIAEECSVFVRALRSSLQNIVHERATVGYAAPQSRLQNQIWYDETYQAMKLQTEILRMLLSAVNLLQYKKDMDENGHLSTETRSLSSTLYYQIALVDPKLKVTKNHGINTLRNALAAAKAVTIHVPTSTNKHFVVIRSVKSFYTGREKQMAKLKAAFEDKLHSGQKRFIIYGLGGSGKTELALKYAQEHADNYWGVFFVDGSSRRNAFGSYADIATIGGVEPNEKAAKNWLMTRDLPWLLIVDNVDDDEVQLEDLLPPGTKGSILVTSRNPAHKSYGNVGQRYLELMLMEKDEANELILRAAEEPSPWPLSIKDSASVICQALGFLPLALVHAAKAILIGLCPWSGYLTFYERQKQRIRRERLRRRDRSLSRSRRGSEEDNDSMNVFSSYEILYQSMESSQDERFQDAVELLHVFSYFHFQNIRLDILIGAAINPLKEAKQMEDEAQEEKALQKKILKPIRKSWTTWLREITLGLRRYLDTPAPLPTALKRLQGLTPSAFEDEVHVRLSEALAVLIKRSLIVRQDRVESRYSMHPLVHKWVRERPEISTSQQSLWCQTALTTLAKSVLRPPLGDTDNERRMRRDLLSHINHARECQVAIKQMLEENRKALAKPIWLTTVNEFGRLQADESARFSFVYSECGDFNEALQLQHKTLGFLVQILGEDHPVSIKVTLLVSGTLWNLSRPAEATRLQRRAYQASMESLGEGHPLTLEVAELLGAALQMKARLAESFALHQLNIEKLENLYGEGHEKTLKAKRNLARVYSRYHEYEKATDLHHAVWQQMKRLRGEKDLETLISLEDLAVSYLRHGEENRHPNSEKHLGESHERMKFVLEQRRAVLGKDQPYTLLATFHLALVKSAMGQHEEALRIITEIIPIAERNIGKDHSAIIAAKCHYARILVELGRYKEAEERLRGLAQKSQYRKVSDEDGDHPDRLAALWFLVRCFEKQGMTQEALDICEDLEVALREIGGNGLGKGHKFASRLQDRIVELRQKLKNDAYLEREELQNSASTCVTKAYSNRSSGLSYDIIAS